MIKDERVSKIVNEILKEEMNETIRTFMEVEKVNREITGRRVKMDYKSMILLYPTTLLEYVENVERSIAYNEEQGNVIKKAQIQLEKWISIYESTDIVEESYEYLRQEKFELENELKKQMKNKEQKEYPYTKEQLEIIDKYNSIIKKQEILEEYAEQNYAVETLEEYKQCKENYFQQGIEASILNLIEVAYPELIGNNKFNTKMLSNMAYNIRNDEQLNDYLDGLMIEQIKSCIKENEIELEDEEEI